MLCFLSSLVFENFYNFNDTGILLRPRWQVNHTAISNTSSNFFFSLSLFIKENIDRIPQLLLMGTLLLQILMTPPNDTFQLNEKKKVKQVLPICFIFQDDFNEVACSNSEILIYMLHCADHSPCRHFISNCPYRS